MSAARPFCSFVAPLRNEQGCVEELVRRVQATAAELELEFEFVCVDDGSDDGTLELLEQLREREPRLKVVSLSRTFGHQVAVMAGLRYASGDCVIVMDGDLQDPPEVAGLLLEQWREGHAVVYAVRRTRAAPWFRRLAYAAYYRLLRALSPLQIPLDAGDFCLMDRKVVRELRQLQEDHPFVRGLRSWVGFSQVGVSYDRPDRLAGTSKYNFRRLVVLGLDGVISFSDALLKAAIFIGFLVSALTLLFGGWAVLSRVLIAQGVLDASHLVPGWAGIVALITFLMGLNFIFLGILGEYVGRIFMQVKRRPLFVVNKELGFGDDPRE